MRGRFGVAALAGAVLVTGCSSSGASDVPTTAGPSSVRSSPTPLPPLPSGAADAPAPAPAAGSSTPAPVSLSVPAIGVRTGLDPLQLTGDGVLQTPSQWQVAGWYAGGVRPGDPGPAVIAGHVDSRAGPAVFYKLRHVKAGDRAEVTRADGSVLNFVVDTVAEYPKDQFPSAAVYGPTALPELRLVTCTGEFDYQHHSYLDNLVVSAHLV